MSIFIDILDKFKPLTEDRILACVYGGIITGLGTAIILKVGSSTGGSDLLSNIIKGFNPSIRVGNMIVIIDIIIVTLNVLFFKEIEVGLYSAIAIYIMGKIIDIIFEGVYFTKLLIIISDKNEEIAKEIGKNIVKQAELDKVRDAKESRTIEFFMGSPDDEAALFFYNGILEALQEYLDDGTLICRSQKLTFDENAIMDENPDTAVKAFQDITEEFYLQEKTPDIICTASDAYAMAVLEELEKEEISPEDESWPLITGCGADADAVKSVAEGKLGFTMMMDRRDLAEDCITFVTTYLKGDDVEVSNYSQYDNGKKLIGTVTCDGKIIDKDNYQILVDNGFYQAEMIAPEATPTPAPEEVSPTPQASLTPEATQAPSGTPGPEITTEEVPEVGDKEEAAA